MTKFEYFKNWFKMKTKESKNYEKIDSNSSLDMYLVYVEHKDGTEYFQIVPKSVEKGNEIARISDNGLYVYGKEFTDYSAIRKWYDSIMEKYDLYQDMNSRLGSASDSRKVRKI